jgi:3',5'-cyclic AMP phosphodiesterase CpdA
MGPGSTQPQHPPHPSAGAGAALGGEARLDTTASNDGRDSTMWRFVQVSDPHLGSRVDGRWNNNFLCTMMPDVIRCLRRDLAEVKPDFILATGDLASERSIDAIYAARDLLDSLGFPYYPMGGNHDFANDQMRAWFLDAFQHRLPVKDTVYSFSHKNLHFCVLDPWWVWQDESLCPSSEPAIAEAQKRTLKGARWAVPPHQLAWLEQDLAAHDSVATIVSTHYPAVPIPMRLKRPGMQDGGCLQNGGLLMEMLRRHPQVKALITGHVHLHFIEEVDRIVHITTGALPEFPTEYRIFEVHEDHIEIGTRGLSDSSFAARSLIPGNEWTAGEERDRSAVVRLV